MILFAEAFRSMPARRSLPFLVFPLSLLASWFFAADQVHDGRRHDDGRQGASDTIVQWIRRCPSGLIPTKEKT
jgi:hypothetical protein